MYTPVWCDIDNHTVLGGAACVLLLLRACCRYWFAAVAALACFASALYFLLLLRCVTAFHLLLVADAAISSVFHGMYVLRMCLPACHFVF